MIQQRLSHLANPVTESDYDVASLQIANSRSYRFDFSRVHIDPKFRDRVLQDVERSP